MTAPARWLIKPTTPRTVHLLNLSGALSSPVQAEATTEADFVRLAALCPNVAHIASQPKTFELPDGKYTPDYRIECRSGQVSYWEIKLEKRIDEYRPTFGAMAALAATQGIRFFAVSNTSIRCSAQHKAAQLIHRYAKAQPSRDAIERVLSIAGDLRSGISMGDLRQRASAPEELILHLLARRRLTFKTRIGIRDADLLTLPEFLEQTDELLLASWLGVSPWRANA